MEKGTAEFVQSNHLTLRTLDALDTLNKPMQPPLSDALSRQLVWLFVLAIPIACVARTVVFEEVFREAREFCQDRSKSCRSLLQRKFFYLFTCEYCFSHYVTIFFIAVTRFHLLLDDWRGYVIAFFGLVFVANVYMNLYSRLRVDISQTKAVIKRIEKAAGADVDASVKGEGE